MTLADVLRQTCIEKKKEYDTGRTVRMAIFGGTLYPIWVITWFEFLEMWIGPATSLSGSIGRALLDACTSSPVFLATYLIYNGTLEGKTFAKLRAKLAQDWYTTCKGAWSLWPLAHTINFALVPFHWRVLYMNIIGIGWGTFLSLMGTRNSGTGKPFTPLDCVVSNWTGQELTNPYPPLAFITVAWLAVCRSSATRVSAFKLLGIQRALGLSACVLLAFSLREADDKQRKASQPVVGKGPVVITAADC